MLIFKRHETKIEENVCGKTSDARYRKYFGNIAQIGRKLKTEKSIAKKRQTSAKGKNTENWKIWLTKRNRRARKLEHETWSSRLSVEGEIIENKSTLIGCEEILSSLAPSSPTQFQTEANKKTEEEKLFLATVVSWTRGRSKIGN